MAAAESEKIYNADVRSLNIDASRAMAMGEKGRGSQFWTWLEKEV
jgi:hypothetical protein